MSITTKRKRNYESERARDIRRIDTQIEKGKRWRLKNKSYDAKRVAERRALLGRDPVGELFNVRKCLSFNSTNALVTADFHLPFDSAELFQRLLNTAKEHSVEDIAIVGDFLDCDNFKEFVGEPWRVCFQQELSYAAMRLQILTDTFKRVYLCRGNHERRWIKGNMGLVTMRNLLALTEVTTGYEVTDDNYMVMNPNNDPWLLCHPKNFSSIALRVPTRLASKYHMNVCSAHGHHWGQGLDDSGRFQVIEAGGMFAKEYIQYLRDISLYPETCSGYYLIQDGQAKPFKGDSVGVITL